MIDPYDRDSLKDLHQRVLAAGASEVDADIIIECAVTLYRESRYEESLEVLHGAMVIEPEHPRAWRLAGSLFENLDRIDDALAAYETALELNEEDWSTSIALAKLYASKRQFPRAQRLLEWLLGEVAPGTDIYVRALKLKLDLDKEAGHA